MATQVLTQRPQEPGFAHQNEHVAQYKFEKEPQEKHHKGWANLDVLIPPSAGLGTTKRYYQRRTMFQYSILFTLRLLCFQNLQSTALRAVALGMLFPGAGLVAVCTIPSLLAFLVTLFVLQVFLAKDTLVDKAGPAWGVACVFMLHGNKWLPNEVKALQDNAVPAPAPGSRELDLKTLRFLQHMIERGLTKHDDLSNHDVIEYCLYPCEPNWTCSLCNLIGMAGLIISSRLLGNDYADRIKPRFECALEDEMTEPDGRILPIRSELTGLTIPGLSGTLSDCINAMNLTAYLPHIGSRVWAIIRREHIYYNKKGRLNVKDLRGADKMDPGNYKGGVGAPRAFIAGCAAGCGDEKVRVDALEELDTEYCPVEATESGALHNKGLSDTRPVVALMARLMRHQDLANATLHGPEPAPMNGPLLADCKFPEVLVAKAYSHDSKGLDLFYTTASKPVLLLLARAIDSWR
ncbi:hypothetical protein LTS15_004958 [Exophiala xenobiotica]|nr:hypothetical protein LTS15_004958 [Exophiala xenobiotica]